MHIIVALRPDGDPRGVEGAVSHHPLQLPAHQDRLGTLNRISLIIMLSFSVVSRADKAFTTAVLSKSLQQQIFGVAGTLPRPLLALRSFGSATPASRKAAISYN